MNHFKRELVVACRLIDSYKFGYVRYSGTVFR